MTFDFTMARSQQVASVPVETQDLLRNDPITQANKPNLSTVDQPTDSGGWGMVIFCVIAWLSVSCYLLSSPEIQKKEVGRYD